MLVGDFEIIITKPFPAALIMSPFGFYGHILKSVYVGLPRRRVAPVQRHEQKACYKY